MGIFNRGRVTCISCGRTARCMTDQYGHAQCSTCAEDHGLITNIVALRDKKKEPDMKSDADILREQAASMLAEAARLEKREEERPIEPDPWSDGDDYEEAPVVTFAKQFPRGNALFYTYAAVGVTIPGANERIWYVTGNQSRHVGGVTWKGLTDFIGEENWHTVRVARGEYPEGAY